MKVYCWASGLIEFGKHVPEGALLIAEAPAKKLRNAIYRRARMGYTPGVLLVPGVPEAEMFKTDPTEALSRFCSHVKACLANSPPEVYPPGKAPLQKKQ